MRVLLAGLLLSLAGCASSTVHAMNGVGQFGDRVLVRRSTTVITAGFGGPSLNETDDYVLCRLAEANQVQCEAATLALPPAAATPQR